MTLKGFKKYEKIIRWVIIIFIIGVFAYSIGSTVKSYQLGRLCNQFRERIADTEDSNRRLAETVGKCQSICGELGDSVDRNIRTAREAVELIEEIRVQVQELENICYSGNTLDSYYDWLDSELGLQ